MVVRRARTAFGALALALAFAAPAHAAGGYVAMGDSIAVGTGADAPTSDNSNVGRLFAWLKTPDGGSLDSLDNTAIRFGSTSQTTDAFRNNGQLSGAVASIDGSSDVRVATLFLGALDRNDQRCGLGKWNNPDCPTASNLAAIFDELNAALGRDPGDEKAIASLYYNPSSGQGGLEGAYETGLLGSDGKLDCNGTGDQKGLNDVIACTAADHGWLVADTYPPIKACGAACISGDGDHPSNQGHLKIAEAYASVLAGHPVDLSAPATTTTGASAEAAVAEALGLPRSGAKLRPDRRGRIALGRGQCPPACGTINVTGKSGTLRLGSGRLVLAQNTSGRLRLTLTRKARAVLKAKKTLAAKIRFKGSANGKTFDFTRAYSLRR